MKTKLLLIGLLVFNTGSAYSQNPEDQKNQIRLEAGYAFTGSGDLEGYCFYNEYSRSVGNRFKIAPSIGILNFFRAAPDVQVLQAVNGISLDLTGYFYPLKTGNFNIETGLGFYVRNWHWIYATGPDQTFGVGNRIIGPGSYFDEYNTAPGYIISIGTVTRISKRLGISIRGVYQNDTNGDNSVTVRFGLRIGL